LKLGNNILESLERAAANDVAGGSGLDDHRLTGEGVGALASLASLASLDNQLGASVHGELLLAGVQLLDDDLAKGGVAFLDVLLVGFSQNDESGNGLGGVHVLSLGLGDGHVGLEI